MKRNVVPDLIFPSKTDLHLLKTAPIGLNFIMLLPCITLKYFFDNKVLRKFDECRFRLLTILLLL